MIGEAIFEFLGWLFIELIWSKFFNFIGGSIRWILGTTWRNIAGKPNFTFREYINGPENPNNWLENAHASINSIIGLITIVVIIGLFNLLS